MTVLWSIVGSISQQILKKQGILVASHIKSLQDISDDEFQYEKLNKNTLKSLNREKFPVINQEIKNKFKKLIEITKSEGNSIGGIVETAVINVPIGLGEPLFLSCESYLSQLIFSIPGVKGVEFGKGFEISRLKGSSANDEYMIKNDKIVTKSNNNGGILGGLSNGSPIVIKTAFKPTPSIAIKQDSVDITSNRNAELEIKGRHDPQIVSRAVHVVNAVVNFAILDLLLLSKARKL